MVELAALDAFGHHGKSRRLRTSLTGPQLKRLAMHGIDDSMTKQCEALSQQIQGSSPALSNKFHAGCSGVDVTRQNVGHDHDFPTIPNKRAALDGIVEGSAGQATVRKAAKSAGRQSFSSCNNGRGDRPHEPRPR